MLRLAILGLALALSFPVVAEDAEVDEAAQAEALAAAQALLTDPSKRAGAASDPEAAKAMQALEKLGGDPKNSQKMYELAAELMETLMKASGGSPDKVMLLLEQGRSNPAGFGQHLTPEQRKKLREIARTIEAGQKKLP